MAPPSILVFVARLRGDLALSQTCMSREALKNSIKQLQQEIHRAELGDRAALDQVHRLAMDLEKALDEEPDQAVTQPMSARFRDEVARLEIEHPRVPAILNEILRTLSNLGI